MDIYIHDMSTNGEKSSVLRQKVLEKYGQLEVLRYGNGKPYVNKKPIHISISHSFNFWVMAVHHYPVGIDIEKHREFASLGEIIKLFHPDEEAYLLQRPDKFLKVWSAKESYMKLLGGGLQIPLKSFSVIKNNRFSNHIGSFHFKSPPLIEEYELSICSKWKANEFFNIHEI